MGCDGGTIPKRDELVRQKKKPEEKDKESDRQFRWLHCALTQQRLQQPIVMCGLGRLYSKQNVIEFLLEKEKLPSSAKHIKSLKDVKDLNLTPNPAYKDNEQSEGLLDVRSAPYICKLIGLEMSGKFRFVALWSCGCVFSERALKEIKTKVCSLCQTPFTDEDIIILNGTEEETELMRTKMENRILKRKMAKKKSMKSLEITSPSTSAILPASTTTSAILPVSTTTSAILPVSTSTSAILPASTSISEMLPELPDSTSTSASTSNLNSQINLKQPNVGRTSKITTNLLTKRNNRMGGLEDPQLKKLKTDYSVAKDPKASDVYKSIFTSHISEQEQSRAHWVT